MEEGKVDNQLLLAQELSEAEREQTLNLNVGYSPQENLWELIVKYNGDLGGVAEELGGTAVFLLHQYAILRIPQTAIGRLTEYPQVEFVEKPKRLFFEIVDGKRASCVTSLQSTLLPVEQRLLGRGVLVAILDSGIDYFHPDFRQEDGTTRIVALWDQTLPAEAEANRYGLGQIFTQTAIDAAIAARQRISSDGSGHGTAVAGIAAGNGRASGGRNAGVAPESDLLVVKLSPGTEQGFAKTTSLMMAVDFALRSAMALGQPLVINISYGNNSGSHDGRSLVEEYLNQAAQIYKTSIVVGAGNEGIGEHHARVLLQEGRNESVSFVLAPQERSVNLQIWKNYYDRFRVELETPSGERRVLDAYPNTAEYRLEQNRVFAFYGEPKPYADQQEIYLEWIPEEGRTYLSGGIWTIHLIPERIVRGNVDFWLPTSEEVTRYTEFLRPDPDTTLTVPSTAERVITVAAYNARTGTPAAFSGWGFVRNGITKPDLAAPGVDVLTTTPGGNYSRRSGTSFAAPFVSGAAALLMEWGIVQGYDDALYGEKLKVYLQSGARAVAGVEKVPDPRTGYGTLCVADSIPG